MENQEIFGKIVQIVRPFVKNGTALEGAGEGTRILEDLNINSARLVDIVLAFEDEFGIEIDDTAADRVQTLGDAVTLIREKRG